MLVRFWGTRGSIPAPGPETLRYGGNTPCVEVRTGNGDGATDGELLILDCGTGARKLGLSLARSGPVKAHLLLGHTHADHIQGLPFFVPAFFPGSELTVYGPGGIDRDLPSAIGGQMEYTYFPVPFESLPATFKFVELGEGDFSIGEVRVRTHQLNHTSPCLGYRLELGGVSLVYALDHEPHSGALWRPDRAPGDYDPAALLHPGDRRHVEFLRGADLLIHDAQYTAAEFPKRVGWGHTSIEQAVDLALSAEVKHLVLFHHDPTRDDDALDDLVVQARARVAETGRRLDVSAAAEGSALSLEEGAVRIEAASNGAAARPFGRARVLVADDDETIARLLDTVLRHDGCDVTSVVNGAEALRLAQEGDFDLILLDVEMPELDGYQTCRAMRAVPKLKDVPIVMLTARGEREDMVEGFAAQATDYMTKPLAIAQVRARIRSWLTRTVHPD
jgi:CheY-like chemotaxis protein/phosphoribosyl 1,2-cyclic phosphodiesterase